MGPWRWRPSDELDPSRGLSPRAVDEDDAVSPLAQATLTLIAAALFVGVLLYGVLRFYG